MVLETNAAFPGKIFQGALELVRGPIRILARRIPVIHVHAEALPSIDMAGDDGAFATENQFIPLPDGLGEILGRSDSIIKGTIQLAGRQGAVGFLLEPFVVH